MVPLPHPVCSKVEINALSSQVYPRCCYGSIELRVPNLLGSRFIDVGFLPKNGSITRDDVKPWDIKKLTVGYQFCSEFEVLDIKGDFDNSETKCLHNGLQ